MRIDGHRPSAKSWWHGDMAGGTLGARPLEAAATVQPRDRGTPQAGQAAAHGAAEGTEAEEPSAAFAGQVLYPRDASLRGLYAQAALAAVPRLLASVDRNPYSPAYGCFDRQYWHYRTSSFPSEMYQEAVLPLAWIYRHACPGNRWQGLSRVRELAIAGMRFAARSSHRDGSCDDYYPFERAFGAAVFSLQAAAHACLLLELDDSAIRAWLVRRARWAARHGETGRLTNHHALAALGLHAVYELVGDDEFAQARDALLSRVLAWQSCEGWFVEYEGADLGYQTLTVECLARLAPHVGDRRLIDALQRAVAFTRWFLHPDDTMGGAYGSRGTVLFFPHGMELLAATHADAADLADAHLRLLRSGRVPPYADDRLYVHRLASLLGAWRDWSPLRPASLDTSPRARYFPEAGLLVHRSPTHATIVSPARGGVLYHCSSSGAIWDTGLVVRTSQGRLAVSQPHSRSRRVHWVPAAGSDACPKTDAAQEAAAECGQGTLVVSGPLYWQRAELATPLKQAALHLAMLSLGRWCRNLVRRALQRRLITGRRPAPIWLSRRIDFLPASDGCGRWRLRITDELELRDPLLRVEALAYSSDLETAYVAAAAAGETASLQPWTDLAELVPLLNRHRRITIIKEM
ncbi:MAG: hypothetical protein K6T86_04360 [Pirellulales bacterium]|nr:hypothetical protein [Pirellulales bacterium]